MEIWKTVIGYENIYEVSNLCRVRSLDHVVHHSNGRYRVQKGRILKTTIDSKGYEYCSLSKKGKRFHTATHRLLAQAFILNPENKPQVNHKNGIKNDNRIENLEWVTNSENQKHAVENNLIQHNRCEKHHMAKLSNEQVKEARELHKKGALNIKLASKYGVTPTAMSKILRKETYINI